MSGYMIKKRNKKTPWAIIIIVFVFGIGLAHKRHLAVYGLGAPQQIRNLRSPVTMYLR